MQTVWGASQDDKIIQKKYMETNKISESMRQIKIQIRKYKSAHFIGSVCQKLKSLKQQSAEC